MSIEAWTIIAVITLGLIMVGVSIFSLFKERATFGAAWKKTSSWERTSLWVGAGTYIALGAISPSHAEGGKILLSVIGLLQAASSTIFVAGTLGFLKFLHEEGKNKL